MQDLGPTFPFLTSLEPRISTHQFRQEWMQLIFRPKVEFESIHECDKGLSISRANG